MAAELEIKCPRCGEPTIFSPRNAFRPFCSERCKLIDLGAWADESYKIPVKDRSQSGDEQDDQNDDRENESH